MSTYVFRLGDGDAPASVVVRFSLNADIDASVRAFDLLRSHPDCDWVRVEVEDTLLLTRTRSGGKQTVVWAQVRPPVGRVSPTRRVTA